MPTLDQTHLPELRNLLEQIFDTEVPPFETEEELAEWLFTHPNKVRIAAVVADALNNDLIRPRRRLILANFTVGNCPTSQEFEGARVAASFVLKLLTMAMALVDVADGEYQVRDIFGRNPALKPWLLYAVSLADPRDYPNLSELAIDECSRML